MSTEPTASAATTASPSGEAVVGVPGQEPERARRRGPGRNLPAAIAVGVGLGALLMVAVFVLPQAFPVVAAIAMVLAVLELTRALAHGGLELPAVPLLVGVIGMVVTTEVFGAEGLLVSTAAAVCVL
ncbi:MAG TPA: phosphatidate cytidylyltransferase, partial [Brachybacterium massiliense]|nr:phosphatidate cytidylyltransferase [Brachybacterium massiliense]